MFREILDVRRCNRCQTVVQALVHDIYDEGTEEHVEAVFWLPRRTHSGEDCERMLEIAKEEWPTLFEMDR